MLVNKEILVVCVTAFYSCSYILSRESRLALYTIQSSFHSNILLKVEVENLNCELSKRAAKPYIWSYKCECVRTHLCVDPAECLSPTAITSHTRYQLRPYEGWDSLCNTVICMISMNHGMVIGRDSGSLIPLWTGFGMPKMRNPGGYFAGFLLSRISYQRSWTVGLN
jgi:hypothetical protein